MKIFGKNPTCLNEYKSDNWFSLFEAKRDWVVIRAQVSSYIIHGENAPRPTVDIVLVGAKYIEIPFEIRGIKITKPKDDAAQKLSNEFDQNSWLEAGERVYSIESEDKRFNVVASNLWIHVHKNRVSVSPLDYFYNGNINRYNDYLENFVQEWIKIE